MSNPQALTPQQKIQFIRGQIESAELGMREMLDCPYCGSVNKRGDNLCCERFGKACMAIIARKGQQEMIDLANKIEDRLN